MRRATDGSGRRHPQQGISIHALREEGDHLGQHGVVLHAEFLSTPSVRRATDERDLLVIAMFISIHALREEGDDIARQTNISAKYFYPRPPRGGRRSFLTVGFLSSTISIHALREEGDWGLELGELRAYEFLSTPSARRATASIIASTRCKW